jgi:phosphomannomutase/phosphoglucomutase
MLKEIIFREYDIRGIVGTELLISEVYALTCAIVAYFKTLQPHCTNVVIGMDGRTHSHDIKAEMARALQDCGMNVTFIGVCASPTLYYAVHTLKVDAGLMITASHNPGEYNGIKICLGKGSVWGPGIQNIKKLYLQGIKPEATHRGSYHDVAIVDDYIAYLKKQFSHLVGMPLAAVVDCGNGSGGTVMPALCTAMEWKHVQLLHVEVDGTYPNHEADPVKEENMRDIKHALATTDAVVGIGLDGDCDRMGAMTKKGFLVPGDQLLALFAQDVIKHHPRCTIVSDIKGSGAVLDLLASWGAHAVLSPSGHAIIKDTMNRNHALLGGELSCHFFFADRYFGYDDAFYALLRLFELLVSTRKALATLLTIIPHVYSSPEYRIAYNEALRTVIIDKIKKELRKRSDITTIDIDGVRATAPYGWGIVRPSNTQPVLCLRFESSTPEGLMKIKQDFMTLLDEYIEKSDKDYILER